MMGITSTPATKSSEGEPIDLDSVSGPSATTKDRILEAALDYFITLGFDGTSLRQIAERVGLTKAALYYHFASKDDILSALQRRLYEIGRNTRPPKGDEPITLEQWKVLLEGMLDQILAEPRLFLMQERNRAALERLHREDNDEHKDIQDPFRRVVGDVRVPLDDRIRMAASLGAVLSSPFLSLDWDSSAPSVDLRTHLCAVLRDVLSPHSKVEATQ
jgi:AcrR family transcriptional regulator